MAPRRKLAAGNWKMNGALADFAQIDALLAAHPDPGCDVLICPPATLISPMAQRTAGTPVQVGAQDCHQEEKGAHTGDIAAPMLAEAGARHVIVGHSERRADHGETDDIVRAKAQAALAAGMRVIVCVGETLEQREGGSTIDVVGGQLQGSVPDGIDGEQLVVAYEPVWAIGTGKVPTNEEIEEVHGFLRQALQKRFGDDTGAGIRLLYGGSVKPSNADEIFAVPDVDGALVGGASLKADDFGGIVAALQAA